MKHIIIICIMIAGLATAPAQAACPAPAAGDTAAEIKANSDRLLCLQEKLASDTKQRQLQLQLDAINARLRDLQLQQQFDKLPQPPVIVVQPPPATP